MVTSLSPESEQRLADQREVLAYNQDRDRPRGLVTPAKSEQQPAESRAPGATAAEVQAAEQEYQKYEGKIIRSDGKPFSTEKTTAVAIKRLGLTPEQVEVQPVAGGFVVTLIAGAILPTLGGIGGTRQLLAAPALDAVLAGMVAIDAVVVVCCVVCLVRSEASALAKP